MLPALHCSQGQDWDFVAHTFWLKHGVAMLFDSLYLADGVTLAYNSGGQHLCARVLHSMFNGALIKAPAWPTAPQPMCRRCLEPVRSQERP